MIVKGKAQTVEEMWQGFARVTLPKGVSDTQRREMRLAFYAGATDLFAHIIHMMDPGVEATDADLVKMDALNTELRAYAKAVASAGGAP